MLDVDARKLLAERAAGASLRDLGQRHAMSHETVRRVAGRESVRFLTSVEMSLHLASKLEQMGRADQAIWPTFLIPFGQPQADWQLAIHLCDWTVTEFRRGGLDITITSRPTEAGLAFMLPLTEEGAE